MITFVQSLFSNSVDDVSVEQVRQTLARVTGGRIAGEISAGDAQTMLVTLSSTEAAETVLGFVLDADDMMRLAP